MGEEHSITGASGAHRWLYCTGSIEAERDIPEKTNPYTEEGTAAHELFEQCLTIGFPARHRIGKHLSVNKNWVVDQEMADAVQTSVDYVEAIGGVQEYEQKVSYERWVREGFGTADVIAVKDDTLYVMDLKYGKGVQVYAEENPQLMLYGLGALDEWETFQTFEKVVLVVLQPRLDHVSVWETTPEHLYDFGEWAGDRAEIALEPGAPRTPGEKQCKWCKAKPTCPALMQLTEDIIMEKFDEMDGEELPSVGFLSGNGMPAELTNAALQTILDNKKLIIDWLNSVEDHVKSMIESGETFPGYKLVNGRSSRVWNDEPKAERLLKRLLGAAGAYEKKLLSIPKAEKALGKEKSYRIEKLVDKRVGPPTLVPESDKREAIEIQNVTAEQLDF